MSDKKLIAPGKWYAEFDGNGNCTNAVYDDSYRKMLGYEAEQGEPDAHQNWSAKIHPDDQERVDAAYIETVKKHPEGLDYDIEYRMLTKRGYRWFHDYGHCTRSEDGSLLRCDGVIFDITDAKAMNADYGAFPLNHDVLQQSNIGLWAFELDEGQPPRMYGDVAMMKLVGVDGPVTPEEMYHAWYDHIDKDHYDEVHEAVDKMGSGLHAEVQYPWHYPDGRTITVRCGGIRNYDYKKGLRIEGTHQDVTETLHYEEEEVMRLKFSEEQLHHEQLRSEVLNYMVDHDDDPIELLKNFAERIRMLLGCDQVIYRDLEETRIMVNSPDIADTWAVPIEFCQQCQHFDAHHPMYAGGYTEMSNCQEGWQGIPVYHECPIKSSLTRLVYCDGEIAGYLAIHYVQHYHEFTELERATLEEFTRILSMSLSRYKAQLENKEKKQLQENMEIIGSFTSEYLAVYYMNLADNTFKVYSVDETRLADTKKLLESKADPLTLIQMFAASSAVHPDDRELFKPLTPSGVKELLKDRKKASIRFRRNYGGEYRWSVVDIVKYEKAEEEANAITLGFAEVDNEVRREQTIARSLEILEKENAPDLSVDELLAMTGNYYGAERAYIFEYDRTNLIINNTYEWCAGGIEAMIDRLQGIPAKEIDGWLIAFRSQGAFYMDALVEGGYNTPEGRALLEMQGISSLIAAPVMKDNEIVGFIGVDNPTRAKNDISVLKTVAAVAHSEILRRKENDEEHVTLSKLTDAFVSVDYVDLNHNYIHSWKINEAYGPIKNSSSNYLETIDNFISTSVLESDRERFKQATKPEYITQQFRDKDRFVLEGTIIGPNGNWQFSNDFIKVSADGTSFVLCCRDVTESLAKEREQQLRLEEALSMAQSANRAKTTFLNNMSHDIRTPMNAIIGFTGLAQKHVGDVDKTKDYLSKISQSSDHLLSLINDVLDMSRIEAGKVNIEEKPENLLDLINGLCDIVQSNMRAKQHDFIIDTIDIKNADIICDKLRLNQVLLNILSNSIKYTNPKGTITLTVSQKELKAADMAQYEFRIADNGMGMEKEYLKTIFDPFTRVKSSTVSGIQGTGLGMAITKSIVELMGGTISVESELGKGTEMTVTFDFKLQDQENAGADAPVQDGKEVSFAGKKILLVEDNPFNREIALELLEDYGFIVDTAEDGDVAVEKMRAAATGDYDLVLMDVQMPRLNGYEATKQIRALGTDISRIPIVAMTANAFEEDRKLALEAGMNEHISKPVDYDKLKSLMARSFK